MLKKYRRKLVVFEAVQINCLKQFAFLGNKHEFSSIINWDLGTMSISTRDGSFREVSIGDWIVKDVSGKFFVVDSAAFDREFERDYGMVRPDKPVVLQCKPCKFQATIAEYQPWFMEHLPNILCQYCDKKMELIE